ncbi:MAG: HesA/MoeB/ThiF family protein [Deltaproteobacteria bacterium]|nr:HesA/MoeB/ThiF family protein [Deltaproteobacteria bacterium]
MEKFFGFSEEQLRRYSRQIILPGVGGGGQRKLLSARVLCVGAGGLGSPASFYLAAAGVGTIGLVDSERVDLSNLQRQILHRTGDVGRPKVESGSETLRAINPEVAVEEHCIHLNAESAVDLFRRYDIIVDCSDNFPTRFMINDACFFVRKTLVWGAVLRFEGQLAVFRPGTDSPCYRCLLPEPPPPGTVPTCQEAGIMGAAAGLIGSMQAMEAIKEILGIGHSLVGKMIYIDVLNFQWAEAVVNKNPDCPLCGEHPSIIRPVDIPYACEDEEEFLELDS